MNPSTVWTAKTAKKQLRSSATAHRTKFFCLLLIQKRTLRFWVQKFSARSIPIVLCKSVVPKKTKNDKNFHYNSLYPEHTKLKISKCDTDTSTGQAAAEPTFHPMTESLQLI